MRQAIRRTWGPWAVMHNLPLLCGTCAQAALCPRLDPVRRLLCGAARLWHLGVLRRRQRGGALGAR
eukprot:4865324-Prymnesium_polylepis.1